MGSRSQTQGAGNHGSDHRPATVRVRAAFTEDVSNDFVREFLAELRASRVEIERAARRNTGALLTLLAAFELITRGAADDASLFFVHLNSLDLVVFGIPPVVAYLSYQSFLMVYDSEYFREVHDSLMELRYPTITAECLEVLLCPPLSPWQQGGRVAILYPGSGRAAKIAPFIVLIGSTFIPVFIGRLAILYLLIRTFAIYGFQRPGPWACAGVAIAIEVLSWVVGAGVSGGFGADATEASPVAPEAASADQDAVAHAASPRAASSIAPSHAADEDLRAPGGTPESGHSA